MTALLCFDLATRTGFAYWRPGIKVISGHFSMPKTGNDVGWFLDDFEIRLREMFEFYKPERCVFEAPWVGEKTSQDTARKLLCLAGVTEMVARRNRAACSEANNASVRKHFIGKGRGDRKTLKDMTMRACRERGWDPDNDDEADALALLSYAADLLKLPTDWPVGGLFQAEAAH